jgi:hypothetical protein
MEKSCTWNGYRHTPENSNETYTPKTKANFLTVSFVLPSYRVKQTFQFEGRALFMGTLYLDSADPCLMNSFY